MTGSPYWDPCISHRGSDVEAFLREYLCDPAVTPLYIGGAGFDPRAGIAAELVAVCGPRARALLIREERPNPSAALLQAADRTEFHLAACFRAGGGSQTLRVPILGADSAVVGGRNAVAAVRAAGIDAFSDVLIDLSALSIGVSFPITRFLLELTRKTRRPRNLHVLISHSASVDEAIEPVSGDVPSYVHGFRGGATLASTAAAARLWLPQLARGRRQLLGKLHSFVAPHDTCPILPFPSRNPRSGDDLATEYLAELENSWSVDPRNVVYAAEDDPLNLYRTILRLGDARAAVFAECDGSLVILSPVGSKVMAMGAMLAALERDLPVAYVESIGYTTAASVMSPDPSDVTALHYWLEGDAYPPERYTGSTRVNGQ